MATGIKYFDDKINTLQTKAEFLKTNIFKRDNNTCVLCTGKFSDKELTLCTIDENEPMLHNTVAVCNMCKVRVIGDNVKRFKMLLGPYLSRTTIIEFNKTTIEE